MNDGIEISLVMATYGRVDEVGRLVASLAQQSRRHSFEWIVVDQNADDRLLPFIEQATRSGLQVRHLRMAVANLSAARNAGCDVARGRWVAFPDDDCWFEADTLERLMDELACHPEWGGGVMDWVEQSAARGDQCGMDLLDLSEWRSFRGGDASSIALVFDLELIRRLAGFDERMGVGQEFGAGEETDLVIRALTAGASIGRIPQARVHHRFGQLTRPNWRKWRHASARGRGTGALYAKHRLSWFVIGRGLVGPFWQSWQSGQGLSGQFIALATVVGRLDGCIRWWMAYGRRPTAR